jgi:hypothetical protein
MSKRKADEIIIEVNNGCNAVINQRISKAAADLVKAALEQMEQTKVEIQEYTASNIKELKTESTALRSDMNNKINTLNQNVQNLIQKVDEMNTTIQTGNKKNNILGAFQRMDLIDKFQVSNGTEKMYSTDIVKLILISFAKDRGHYIEKYSMFTGLSSNEEGRKKQFKDKIVGQIHMLTGTKPLITEDGERVYIRHG